MAEHTPGPWRVEKANGDAFDLPAEFSPVSHMKYLILHDVGPFCSGPIAATMPTYAESDSRAEADARLIALAPELLAELIYLVDLADNAMQEANRDGGEYDRTAELGTARNLIAAAGQTAPDSAPAS